MCEVIGIGHDAVDVVHDTGVARGFIAEIAQTWYFPEALGNFSGGRKASQNPLPALVIGAIEPMQQGLEICVVRNIDPQDFGCNATIEPFDRAVGLRRVSAGPASIDGLSLAGFLERVRGEA